MNGINIEQWEKEYNLLDKERSRDININTTIASEIGERTIYFKGTLPTFYKNLSQKQSILIIVKVDTLANICNKYILKHK